MFPVVISEPPGLFSVMPKSFQYFTNNIFLFQYMLYSILYGLRSFQIDSNYLYNWKYIGNYIIYTFIIKSEFYNTRLLSSILQSKNKPDTTFLVKNSMYDKWSKLVYFFCSTHLFIKLSNLLWFADILTITYIKGHFGKVADKNVSTRKFVDDLCC